MGHRSTLAILAWLCASGLALAAETAAPAPKLELRPCTGIPGLPPDARCGTYEVWENRAAKSGRKIPLRVLVLPAVGPDRLPDPLVFFNGGPGDSNVDAASWLAEELKALRKRRDILLVDFRGTGGSAGLFCTELQGSAGLQGTLDHFLPPGPVKACAERLSRTADLSQYTNDTSVDDVDEVRAALGYDRINIFGGSAGSRSGLVYLRRHPDKVRAAVLSGLVPMDDLGPFDMARSAQRALDGLIAECEGDAGCHGSFPRLRDEIAAVLERAGKDPVTVALTDRETGKAVEVRLTRSAVAQALRAMLYSPVVAARLPLKVHLAAQGDWKPLAETAQAWAAGFAGLAAGNYLSLTCAEELPFLPEDKIPAAVQGTFLGDFRIRAQQAACAAWPVPPVDREFLEPVTSDVPVLLISGERDPVTPPGNAEHAARTLENSLHVVVPDAGHSFGGIEGWECINDLAIRVVEAGTVKGLDTSCLARTKRPEFVKFGLVACATSGLPKDARCGTYEVFENRAARSGRKIPLQVVVLPATGPDRLPDPLVYFGGGPGVSSIDEGMGFASPDLRKDRDVLLIDARGTGRSAALNCDELRGTVGVQGFLEEYMPVDKVLACRERLRTTVDLTQYSTDNVVDDAEEIRLALGYGKVNLIGSSYGARPVQVYMRRHPGSVRTAVMVAVVPVDEAFPLVTARYAQQALDGLIAECEGDPACNKAFPELREEVAAVLRRVEREPVRAQALDAETGQPFEVVLSKNGLGQVLRRMLYYNQWISLVPLYVHRAANGDWQPLAEFAQLISGARGGSSEGYFLSITCSEDLAFVRDDEIPAAVAGTFLGDLRVRAQQAACEGWPAPRLGSDFRVPVASDVPTLLLSGGADPVTPPSSGERVARALQRSRHIVVPDGGHGLEGMEGGECVERMISAFIAAGAAESLDTSCVAGMRRPDFLVSLEPEVKLKPEELERLAGTWLDEDGTRITTEVVGGYLRVVFPNASFLLAATSPTRFRLRTGEPGIGITFGLEDGRAVSLTLEGEGGPETLTREGDAEGRRTAVPAPKLELRACTGIPGLPPEARCGIYEVWENRAAKSGRKIPLRVLVIPAEGPDRQPDPFVFFNGGPGESNVDAAPWIVEELGAVRKQRDILLVDFRGTGGTAALVCPEMQESSGLQEFLDHFLPLEPVKACAERLAKTTDLTRYTNDTSVDDIDEVRAALGYDKINIYGGSGGSRSGLVYLRRHPDRVRTAIHSGLVPTDERGPFSMARHAQRALDGLIAECDADAACRGAFPRLRDEVAAVLRQIEKEPVTLAVTDGETGKPVEVRLTRNAVAQTLRYMLYSPLKAARLPWSVQRAAQGDWMPLAEEALSSGAGLGALNRGYYLSLTCAEDLPFIREDEVPAAVRGTFLGDFRIRAQQAACAAWPVPPVGREFLDPVTSDVPVLLISGERDPVTPPSNAERAALTLENSLHVVVPDAGHSFSGIEGWQCIDDLTVKVVETGTVKGLDTSCTARMKRPEFVLKRDARVRLEPCKVPGEGDEKIDALCGTYRVWEDREAKAGRRIGLRVVVLPALSAGSFPDPVFYLSGGPGTAATGVAGYLAGSPLRQERDLVFVDQRGTGEPDRLVCRLTDREHLQGYFGETYPPDAVRRCRDELGKTYDLTRYTTTAAVDDFDEVRDWLGYDKVNLVGSSYGTRTAQTWLRRHPESVRTVTLWGVVPMDEPISLSFAESTQRSLDLLLGWCEEDAACRARFPGVRKDFQAVMDRLSPGPVEVEVAHPETGQATRVRLSRDVVANCIRLLLYSNESGAALPLFLRQAAAGDWKPFVQTAAAVILGLEPILARGLSFSVLCSEDIPFLDPAEVSRRAAGSFLGDSWIRRQTAACELWPRARIDPAQREPIRSDVPVLLINGERDPVTPPDFGRRASRYLTRSLHLVEPYASHEEIPPCVDGIANEFLRRGTIQGLDTSCLRQEKRVPFLLEIPEGGINPFG
jgi:pimeloyl-ACP methyl ester carboxylesterase